MKRFSWIRLWAIIVKEFIQMRRDRATFAMMIGIPLMQLILFGLVINTNPKNLPTAIVAADQSEFTRSFLQSMKNTGYFSFLPQLQNEQQAQKLLARGDVQFVVNIPPNFTRDLVRGTRPAILVEMDATDPIASSNPLCALQNLSTQGGIGTHFVGPLQELQNRNTALDLRIHPVYNPLAITQYNIVPGLMGVVLTMTMVVITSLAMTRERERGTMENLLATPARPLEIILGKIAPYIIVGYIQVTVILLVGHFFFAVPFAGSVILLYIACLPFIAANLAVGLTFSTLAKNQLQATQSAMFFFLPSILLAGFLFPFRGMPEWAQWIGNILPLTHFLVIVRGLFLKGNGLQTILPSIVPILLFTVAMVLIGLKRFRKTLD